MLVSSRGCRTSSALLSNSYQLFCTVVQNATPVSSQNTPRINHIMCRFSTILVQTLLIAISFPNIIHQASALVDVDKSGTVAEYEFVHDDLIRDPSSASSAFLLSDGSNGTIDGLPPATKSRLARLEKKLQLKPNATPIDNRSGRVEVITLSEPILPGDGVGNRFLWGVGTVPDDVAGDSRGGSHDEHHRGFAPTTNEEWSSLAITALQHWMTDHAADLDVDVTELFSDDNTPNIRTGVHGDGDMIQLHIPRLYKGVKVVGSRLMATVKMGNLINVGLEGE